MGACVGWWVLNPGSWHGGAQEPRHSQLRGRVFHKRQEIIFTSMSVTWQTTRGVDTVKNGYSFQYPAVGRALSLCLAAENAKIGGGASNER